MRSQLERERRKSAFILAEKRAIDPYRRGGHCPFEIHKHAFSSRVPRIFEPPAISRDKCIFLLIEAVPRQLNVGVRNSHDLKRRIIEIRSVSAIHFRRVVPPTAIHRQYRSEE